VELQQMISKTQQLEVKEPGIEIQCPEPGTPKRQPSFSQGVFIKNGLTPYLRGGKHAASMKEVEKRRLKLVKKAPESRASSRSTSARIAWSERVDQVTGKKPPIPTGNRLVRRRIRQLVIQC
jgi:hypothetical protein